MRRIAMLATLFSAVLVIVLPFTGGSGPSIASALSASSGASTAAAVVATATDVTRAVSVVGASEAHIAAVAAPDAAHLKVDTEHAAQKPVPKPEPVVHAAPGATSKSSSRTSRSSGSAAQPTAGANCPAGVGGSTAGAPGRTSSGGVSGTTSDDINSFAAKFNAVRVANCLAPVPMSQIRYDSCMEDRLFWMAEDPSEDPASAWGHMGSTRSDGVPSRGCDGNLAGGTGNSGATVAQKWWDSIAHRNSLYRPSYTGSTAGVCIGFAMTHGGVPNEPYSFTRSAARWMGC